MSSDPKVLTSSWVFPFTNATCSKQQRSCSLRRIRTSRHTQDAQSVSTSHDRGYAYKPVGDAGTRLGKHGPCAGNQRGWFDLGDLQQQSLLLPKHHLYRRQQQIQTTKTFWPCIGRSTQPKDINVPTRQRTIANAGIEL